MYDGGYLNYHFFDRNIGNIEKILENAVFPVNISTSSISFSGREVILLKY